MKIRLPWQNGATRAFDEAACPVVAFDASEVPSEVDLAIGVDTDGNVPGPDVSEPAPTADEN